MQHSLSLNFGTKVSHNTKYRFQVSGVRKRGQMVDDRGQKIEIGSRNAEAKKELAAGKGPGALCNGRQFFS